jgi:hypothetical protein
VATTVAGERERQKSETSAGFCNGTRVAEEVLVLRISRIKEPSAGLCLKVEGRLSGDGVALLEGELADAARSTRRLSLDLAAVDFASLQAAELLRAATARGVRVVACSPFLAKLLVTSAS